MKLRTGFVSNSSSCSFVIKNLSDSPKTLEDFVRENPFLLQDYEEWNYGKKCSLDQFLEHLEMYKQFPNTDQKIFSFYPHEEKEVEFDDHDFVERMFHYALESGGSSVNFEWWFLRSYH